jgi:hypothetical protein
MGIMAILKKPTPERACQPWAKVARAGGASAAQAQAVRPRGGLAWTAGALGCSRGVSPGRGA